MESQDATSAQNTDSADVIIIGAGVIGCALALELSGHAVKLGGVLPPLPRVVLVEDADVGLDQADPESRRRALLGAHRGQPEEAVGDRQDQREQARAQKRQGAP